MTDESLSGVIRSLDKDPAYKQGEIKDACRRMSAALPLARSIDNYLHSHNHSKAIEKCGKLGIVGCILRAERKSLLQIHSPDTADAYVDFSALKDTWYNRLASLIFQSTFEDLKQTLENLTVISFNYDRCFEHFMYHSIITYYGCQPQVAADVVKSMAIYHPYGSVGYLPWMEWQPAAHFGEQVEGIRLLALSEQIKTYTEGVERDSLEIKAIHTALREAKNVIFLGFGYIPLNMELLRPGEDPNWIKVSSQQKQYWGTAYRLSDEDTNLVTSAVKSLVQTGVVHAKINNKVTCAGLFNEYGFTLSDL